MEPRLRRSDPFRSACGTVERISTPRPRGASHDIGTGHPALCRAVRGLGCQRAAGPQRPGRLPGWRLERDLVGVAALRPGLERSRRHAGHRPADRLRRRDLRPPGTAPDHDLQGHDHLVRGLQGRLRRRARRRGAALGRAHPGQLPAYGDGRPAPADPFWQPAKVAVWPHKLRAPFGRRGVRGVPV